MWTPEYFVRLLDLPPSVEGVTVPNDDGTFDIYINSLLSEERQREKLAHELEHIRKDHFYNDIKTVREVEAEAKGCRCGDVLRGLIDSEECPMFGTGCKPMRPMGPCMVSQEGGCNIAFRFSGKKRL